jgi:NitT/TauT family transport system substrate-binding protein
MMNEINSLVWPAPDGIGVLNVDSWNQTVQTATEGGVLTAAPSADAYRTDLTAAALEGLDNATGTDWQKPVVEVTPGGE